MHQPAETCFLPEAVGRLRALGAREHKERGCRSGPGPARHRTLTPPARVGTRRPLLQARGRGPRHRAPEWHFGSRSEHSETRVLSRCGKRWAKPRSYPHPPSPGVLPWSRHQRPLHSLPFNWPGSARRWAGVKSSQCLRGAMGSRVESHRPLDDASRGRRGWEGWERPSSGGASFCPTEGGLPSPRGIAQAGLPETGALQAGSGASGTLTR